MLLLPLLQFAQEEFNIETRVEARLESVLILNVDPEIRIEFGVSEVSDNLYQITQPPDDINFSVESTGNWNLSITASEPYFTGVNDPTQKIPVDFVGFFVENRGNNWDNGLFSNIANRTKDTIISLSDERKLVLTNGNRNNIGGADRNAFVLRWKFIYEDDVLKIRKFSNLDIKDDHFVGRFYITLSENKMSGTSINIPHYDEPVAGPVETEPVITGETSPTTVGYLEEKEEKKK
nr:hypothetical protein [Bacteroidota bacterium]